MGTPCDLSVLRAWVLTLENQLHAYRGVCRYAQKPNWEPQLEASPPPPKVDSWYQSFTAPVWGSAGDCRQILFVLRFDIHKSTIFVKQKHLQTHLLGSCCLSHVLQFLPVPHPKSRILLRSALPWGQAQRQRPGKAADFCVMPRMPQSQAPRWATGPVDHRFFFWLLADRAHFDIYIYLYDIYAKTHFEDF